jgi:isocitrate/isopropylmalate dehydrogenase
MTTNRFNIGVIKGDGIGVYVANAALEVLEADCRRRRGFALVYSELSGGAAYYRETGLEMAPDAEKKAEAADAIEAAVQRGFGEKRIRPVQYGGDQGTVAVTKAIVDLIRRSDG